MTKYLIIGLLLAGSHVGAAVLFSDNFDAGPFGLNTTPMNWMVSSGTVDTLTHGSFGLPCRGGVGGCVDLDGTTAAAGLLETLVTFNLSAGQTYLLEYYLAGSQRGDVNVVTVSLGSFSQIHTLASSAPYTLFSFSYTPLGNEAVRIRFSNAGGDNLGALLDDVTLSKADTVVPEPSSLLLIGGGSGLLSLLHRRRA